MKNASRLVTTLHARQPSLLSSRAQPRDLQFRGLIMETRNSIVKQNCHLDRSVA
jgi:hypothetical protein